MAVPGAENRPNTRLWKQMLRSAYDPGADQLFGSSMRPTCFVREVMRRHGRSQRRSLERTALHSVIFLPTILSTLGLIFYGCLAAVCGDGGRGAGNVFTRIFRIYSCVMFCCGQASCGCAAR